MFFSEILPTRSLGRGTRYKLVEGWFARGWGFERASATCANYSSTILRTVPLPIRRWGGFKAGMAAVSFRGE